MCDVHEMKDAVFVLVCASAALYDDATYIDPGDEDATGTLQGRSSSSSGASASGGVPLCTMVQYGQLVVRRASHADRPPRLGKDDILVRFHVNAAMECTKYAADLTQFLTAVERPVQIVNLDPANDTVPYPCAVSLSELISVRDVMAELDLGPNVRFFPDAGRHAVLYGIPRTQPRLAREPACGAGQRLCHL